MTEPSEQPPTTPMPGPPPGSPQPQWQPPSPAGPPVFSPGAAEVSYPSDQDQTQGYPGYPPTQGYPYGPSAYPPPPIYPTPPRRRRTGLIVTAVVVLVLLVLGGAAAGGYLLLKDRIDGVEAGPTTPSASGAPRSSAPSPTAKPFDGDLRELLVAAPAGAGPVADPISANERLTASQIASRYRDRNAALEMLEARKFQQGAVRQWRVGTGTFVTVQLYQLGDAAKANAMVADMQFGNGRDPNLADKKSIDGISLGQVLLFKKGSGGYTLAMALFSKGDIAVEIEVFTQSGPADAAQATRLAQDQFAKLP